MGELLRSMCIFKSTPQTRLYDSIITITASATSAHYYMYFVIGYSCKICHWWERDVPKMYRKLPNPEEGNSATGAWLFDI